MVFKVLFFVAALLAVGWANEEDTKCVDNCTDNPEEKVSLFFDTKDINQ